MNMKKCFLWWCLLAGWASAGMAQRPTTVCHEDGRVTFQYKNDHAKEVMVDVQFAGRNAMKRDAQTGLWTVTLGPAAPDLYPYCFVVDGVSVMNPECEAYFPNEGFKNSLLEIPSRQGSLPHDIKPVPHGTVEYVHYYSKSLGGTNNAIVYLPPSYNKEKQKKYPVFYLISGTTDTEEVYYKVGRVNYILDNLLAEGKAEEMIVVLPYGNPTKLLPQQPEGDGRPQTQFGKDVFSLDLVNDLMPWVEQHYRTINDADHRAIGGFSRGGNQGLSNGLRHLDKFSYLCSYSSFTSTDIPDVYDHATETNSKIHLFWLGVGTDDFLYGNARDYMEFLDKKGIRSVKEYTHDKFGHTWMNAKYFLDKTLRLLFRPEAAEEAMKKGKPALAATGKEQQFTASVMARLFPRAVVSPEFGYDHITFRINAPTAKEVLFESEYGTKPMQKDADGVWSIRIEDHVTETFKYCFVVDGTQVADPSNMYLSPDKGFKSSVSNNPAAPYGLAAMGDIPHGRVSYDLNLQVAYYFPPVDDYSLLPIIRLIPGKDDTMESWFKLGGADAMADKLLAEGKTKPCVMLTDVFAEASFNNTKIYTLKASDYKTWAERRKALEQLLLSLK
jgi:enterochelin esterase-like enzyme